MGDEGVGRLIRDRFGPDADFVIVPAGGRTITTLWGRADP